MTPLNEKLTCRRNSLARIVVCSMAALGYILVWAVFDIFPYRRRKQGLYRQKLDSLLLWTVFI